MEIYFFPYSNRSRLLQETFAMPYVCNYNVHLTLEKENSELVYAVTDLWTE